MFCAGDCFFSLSFLTSVNSLKSLNILTLEEDNKGNIDLLQLESTCWAIGKNGFFLLQRETPKWRTVIWWLFCQKELFFYPSVSGSKANGAATFKVLNKIGPKFIQFDGWHHHRNTKTCYFTHPILTVTHFVKIYISRLVLVKYVFPTFYRNAEISILQLKIS